MTFDVVFFSAYAIEYVFFKRWWEVGSKTTRKIFRKAKCCYNNIALSWAFVYFFFWNKSRKKWHDHIPHTHTHTARHTTHNTHHYSGTQFQICHTQPIHQKRKQCKNNAHAHTTTHNTYTAHAHTHRQHKHTHISLIATCATSLPQKNRNIGQKRRRRIQHIRQSISTPTASWNAVTVRNRYCLLDTSKHVRVEIA